MSQATFAQDHRPSSQIASWRRALRNMWLYLTGRGYRPEKHYMRGPRKTS